MTFQRRLRKLHKLVGALVFIQLILWMLSGLYMTSVPIDIIHGDHLVKQDVATPLQKNEPRVSVEYLLQNYSDVYSVELTNRLNSQVYFLKTSKTSFIVDPQTGLKATEVNEKQALSVAAQSYTGAASVKTIQRVTNYAQAPDAKGRSLPLWRVEFDDTFASTFYISTNMGRIVAVRSDLWRIFDFFWMLHIMDYEERDDFNNPLVILMASLGLLMVLSGILLLVNVLRKKGLVGLVR